jgi:hypothetical protein
MIVLCNFLYIIIGLFLWFILGHLSNVILYLRRKLTGLPINHSNPNLDDKKFRPNKVSYMCLGHRTNPEKNYKFMSFINIYTGPISLLFVLVSLFTHVLVPTIAWCSLSIFDYFFNIKDDRYKLENFINFDINI